MFGSQSVDKLLYSNIHAIYIYKGSQKLCVLLVLATVHEFAKYLPVYGTVYKH